MGGLTIGRTEAERRVAVGVGTRAEPILGSSGPPAASPEEMAPSRLGRGKGGASAAGFPQGKTTGTGLVSRPTGFAFQASPPPTMLAARSEPISRKPLAIRGPGT